jgi:hypothetical protein
VNGGSTGEYSFGSNYKEFKAVFDIVSPSSESPGGRRRHKTNEVEFHVYDDTRRPRLYSTISLRRYSMLIKVRASISELSYMLRPTLPGPEAIIWVFENSEDPWSILSFDAIGAQPFVATELLESSVSEVVGKIPSSWMYTMNVAGEHVRLLVSTPYHVNHIVYTNM